MTKTATTLALTGGAIIALASMFGIAPTIARATQTNDPIPNDGIVLTLGESATQTESGPAYTVSYARGLDGTPIFWNQEARVIIADE